MDNCQKNKNLVVFEFSIEIKFVYFCFTMQIIRQNYWHLYTVKYVP